MIRIAAATVPIQSRVSIWSVPGEWAAKARPFYSGGAAPRPPDPAACSFLVHGNRKEQAAGGTRPILALAMRSDLRPSNALRLAVRVGGVGAIAAAAAVPLLRRRLRVPTPVTVAGVAAAPLALAVLQPRSKRRDVALFALQMWAFTVAHELPYDNPERLRARLRTRYPIVVDRAIGAGRLPNARLQRALARLPQVKVLNQVLTWTHWLWFVEPYLSLALILARHHERFPRSA